MSIDDFDAIECNEAFAAIALMWSRAFQSRPGQVQPSWRGDRYRPPSRCERGQAGHDTSEPARGDGWPLRVPDHVRGRRPGERDRHRACELRWSSPSPRSRRTSAGAVATTLAAERSRRATWGDAGRRSRGHPRALVEDGRVSAWLGVLVPRVAGGLGLGLVDLVVLQEELGRVPFPGPFLSSAVAATTAAVRSRRRESACRPRCPERVEARSPSRSRAR